MAYEPSLAVQVAKLTAVSERLEALVLTHEKMIIGNGKEGFLAAFARLDKTANVNESNIRVLFKGFKDVEKRVNVSLGIFLACTFILQVIVIPVVLAHVKK